MPRPTVPPNKKACVTGISLPPALAASARKYAIASGKSLSGLIRELLIMHLKAQNLLAAVFFLVLV
jgi:hypothetical protein